MKLRNKKTGEIVDLSVGYIRDAHNGEFIQIKPVACLEDKGSYLYDTFAKFSEDWEDYKPAKPYIKDEKIRKAVRAWAEVNDFEPDYKVRYSNNSYSLFSSEASIEFDIRIKGLEHLKDYTIEELCGEEEE